MKCYLEFDGPIHQLLILGEHEDYARAAKFLENKDEAYLNDPEIAIYIHHTHSVHEAIPKSEVKEALYIDKEECRFLAEEFQYFGANKGRYHNYYNTKALNKYEVEIKMSVGGEYSYGFLNRD